MADNLATYAARLWNCANRSVKANDQGMKYGSLVRCRLANDAEGHRLDLVSGSSYHARPVSHTESSNARFERTLMAKVSEFRLSEAKNG